MEQEEVVVGQGDVDYGWVFGKKAQTLAELDANVVSVVGCEVEEDDGFLFKDLVKLEGEVNV